jgi:hypothetical protein
MTRTGLSIGLLLASTLAALAAPELLFKHNENGGVVEGSQTKLMEAIRSGRSVKVVYTRSNVSWQRLCLHASVTSASGNEVVSCVITAIPDTIDAPSMKGRILGTPTAFETAIFNSSGLRHTHKLDAKGNLLVEEQVQLAIGWYAG